MNRVHVQRYIIINNDRFHTKDGSLILEKRLLSKSTELVCDSGKEFFSFQVKLKPVLFVEN